MAARRPTREGVQWFFKEEIQSRGWYTAELRKVALRFRRTIVHERDMKFLLKVADHLFRGRVLEEKIFAVFLLEEFKDEFGDAEFSLFESWLGRISSWADHDALVHYLIAPMVAGKTARSRNVFVWARSKNRWHRRAACVALIRGAREKMFLPEIKRLSNSLLRDEDDMVLKGLGWLLRETAKHSAPGPFRIFARFVNGRLGWCCGRRAKHCQFRRARGFSRREWLRCRRAGPTPSSASVRAKARACLQ